MSEPLLQVRKLSKVYPSGTQALVDVSFQVRQGEFLAIIGSSGAGKSTLLRCLNRLQDPSAGEILYQGLDVASLRRAREIRELRKKIGMIFQSFNLLPRQSVLQNVLMGRLAETGTLKSIFGLFSAQDAEAALQYLSWMGIADKAHSRAGELSGGQQQRVAIARALSQKPELLLADEPVASLDPRSRQTVMDYLQKANRELNLTVIANLHSVALVRQYATRFIALKEGRILFDGDPRKINDELLKQIYGSFTKEENEEALP